MIGKNKAGYYRSNLTDEAEYKSSLRVNATVIEQIKYLEELERLGLLEKPISQTAYKYPINLNPNRTLK